MYESIKKRLTKELEAVKVSGRYKKERVISSNQNSEINVNNKKVLNFCANNYLGLASNTKVIKRAKDTLDSHGFGMASVRFICGTQDIHKELETKISDFLQKEDTILYAAAFDANGGLFEPLFNDQDAIISDALNHASIIDGIRLCKAKRFRYKHNDMQDLEIQLQNAEDSRNKIIVTDGVFSMDGTIAQLDKICELAKKYDAMVMSDECHSTGFIGPNGRGVHEELDVIDQVDIITGTLGKALGGASGGFTSGPKEIIDLLRQKSRPYLFSNTLAPSIVGASLEVLDILESDNSFLNQLKSNTKTFRDGMMKLGFDIKPGSHPIVPVMLYDDHLAQKMSSELLDMGIYVIGFFFPVVPKGEARIRVQLSASHSTLQINQALNAFEKIGKKLGVIN
ncbi:glycine C-acetyltransferase [Flavobacteriaceae bacterium]|jgi:glycine C-acetyltransferase|nr:glycine C-acetyltransferase [Flavobacteriaceae bacterium]MDB4148608.1 glycine C-acetyltransferase [Flavobacteriaceae bacterium]MDC1336675.1 glycine C-acetyltransferase [Flavobacteriaceae bacterium]MDC1456175.1 glycine C-acetyltransferase [Flavobacteriaceae bacterium]|tara:strand:+ start:313 stop:1500 length:1188 start_codon:yes stop_codon:yes gene_type:complete